MECLHGTAEIAVTRNTDPCDQDHREPQIQPTRRAPGLVASALRAQIGIRDSSCILAKIQGLPLAGCAYVLRTPWLVPWSGLT